MTKYKNKHLKEAILPNQVIFCIGIIGAAFGIFILSFGLIRAAWQFDHVNEFSEVLSQASNQANKMVYIDIISVPEKISEDENEGYYLVVTEDGSYISGMQEEQFETLKKTVEANGQTRLYGMTKVVLDESRVTIWTDYRAGRIYEEDARYLEDIFRKKNIDFKCHIELLPEEEE